MSYSNLPRLEHLLNLRVNMRDSGKSDDTSLVIHTLYNLFKKERQETTANVSVHGMRSVQVVACSRRRNGRSNSRISNQQVKSPGAGDPWRVNWSSVSTHVSQ